jgi:peptidoglycan/LPS O-acetylase OafA/YrhL
MKSIKVALAKPIAIIGLLLAGPSLAILFVGALALKLLPWFPPFETLFIWSVALALALLVGAALINLAKSWQVAEPLARSGTRAYSSPPSTEKN